VWKYKKMAGHKGVTFFVSGGCWFSCPLSNIAMLVRWPLEFDDWPCLNGDVPYWRVHMNVETGLNKT
jgi:hypothetical protein